LKHWEHDYFFELANHRLELTAALREIMRPRSSA
jgi:hypothetical protein